MKRHMFALTIKSGHLLSDFRLGHLGLLAMLLLSWRLDARPQNNHSDTTVCITIQTGLSQDSSAFAAASIPDSNSNALIHGARTDIATSWWTYGGVSLETRGLLKFVIPDIPREATVLSAKLSLFAADSLSTNGYQGEPTYGSNNACYIKRVTSPWSMFGVTWNNQPSTTDSGEVLLAQVANYNQDYVNLDVTQFVSEWVQDSTTNNGLMIQMIGSQVYNSLVFCSSYYPVPSRRPKLDICYKACNAVASFTFQIAGTYTLFNNTSSTSSGQTMHWTFYNANGSIGTSTDNSPWFQFTGQQPYSATLVVQDSINTKCVDSLKQQIQILGIDETTNPETALRIFPNPLSGANLKVILPAAFESSATQIKMFDVLGEEIPVSFFKSSTQGLQVAFNDGLPTGLYSIKATCHEKQVFGKLVVIK